MHDGHPQQQRSERRGARTLTSALVGDPSAEQQRALRRVLVRPSSNLVPGDTNGVSDIFRHDNVTGETIRVSVDNGGQQLSTPSGGGARCPATAATSCSPPSVALDPGDTNERRRRLRPLGRRGHHRVGEHQAGRDAGLRIPRSTRSLGRTTISDDGRYVLVTDSLPGQGHGYLRDRRHGHAPQLFAAVAADAILTGDGRTVVESLLCTGGAVRPRFDSPWRRDGSGAFEYISEGCGFRRLRRLRRRSLRRRRPLRRVSDVRVPGRERSRAVGHGHEAGRGHPGGGLERGRRSRISNDGRFVTVRRPRGRRARRRPPDRPSARSWTPSDLGRPGECASRSAGPVATSRSARPTPLTADDTNGVDDVFTRYSLTPAITAVNPATVTRGAHLTVRILGQAFLPGVTVAVPGSGITVDDVTLVNPGRIDVDVTIAANATAGPRDLVVTNTGPVGGATAWCPACLTIGELPECRCTPLFGWRACRCSGAPCWVPHP